MRALTLIALLVPIIATHAGSVVAQEEISPAGRRIVGGEKTDIRQHPWQVALNIRIDGRTYLCGGSIIADRWVLTAAHCFIASAKPADVRVKSGATNYVTSGVWLEVERVILHKDYNARTHENDLALVLLLRRPPGQLIPLPPAGQAISPGRPLEVTGWGATSEGGDAGRVLMKASVPYVDTVACNAPSAYNGSIKAGMLCAGYRGGGVDSCQGDSGGPLVWRTGNGPVLVGVVSWGEGCARKLRYGVYTRVATYAAWIQSVVAGKAQ